MAQAAALHSPDDLRIYLLTDSSGKASWEWARWLPHCRPQAAQDCAMLVGNDAESVATRIAELLAIMSARQQAAKDAGHRQARFRPDIVVVFDGSRKLRTLPGAIQLLQEGPRTGIYAICLDSDEQLLPAECQAVVVMGPDGVRVQQAKAETLPADSTGRRASGLVRQASAVHGADSRCQQHRNRFRAPRIGQAARCA